MMTLGFRPLAGCGLFPVGVNRPDQWISFRPLAGCGLFLPNVRTATWSTSFRPLAGCGLFRRCFTYRTRTRVSVPLRGVGCFDIEIILSALWEFPSPCGVWVVSSWQFKVRKWICFRPLAGCGLFPLVLVVLRPIASFRPLAGCGLFPNSLLVNRSWLVSVPLRGVGCFGKAAHSFWCNRKKNCQLCYFIVSYWQMFINSKLRNCKVPCEAHKTAT